MKHIGIFILICIIGIGSVVGLLVFTGYGTNSVDQNYEFELTSDIKNVPNQTPILITFRIRNSKGDVVKKFEIAHDRLMHFFVVKKDLMYFQHLHPEYDPNTGEFRIDVTFPTDGPYRLFADFTPAEKNPKKMSAISFADIGAGINKDYQPTSPAPAEATKKIYGEYTVTYMLPQTPPKTGEEFSYGLLIEKDGKKIKDLEPYLGSLGHSVILKADSLDFIHTHALAEHGNMDGGQAVAGSASVVFTATIPQPGIYKIFSEFQHKGNIITADQVISVQ